MPADSRVNVGTAAVFLRDEGRGVEILLIHRRPDASHGGDSWAPPGGWIDYGQSPAEAASREALEEVRMQCKPEDGLITYTMQNTYPEQDKHIFVEFKAYDDSTLTNVEPEKCDGVSWVPVTDLHSCHLFPPFHDYARAMGWV